MFKICSISLLNLFQVASCVIIFLQIVKIFFYSREEKTIFAVKPHRYIFKARAHRISSSIHDLASTRIISQLNF